MQLDAPRWQPVMLVINKRLECQCGALAIFVTGKIAEKYNILDDVDVWCQNCYEKSLKDGTEDDDDA